MLEKFLKEYLYVKVTEDDRNLMTELAKVLPVCFVDGCPIDDTLSFDEAMNKYTAIYLHNNTERVGPCSVTYTALEPTVPFISVTDFLNSFDKNFEIQDDELESLYEMC